MNKLKRKRIFPLIMIIITALYIGFIWIHSTFSADDSSAESTGVLNILKNILDSLGVNVDITEHIVRKSAHFCEFALLGLLSLWTAYSLNGKVLSNLMPCAFVCLATAVIDELIQIYSPGRSSQVTDVALDFCGAAAGVVFFILVLSIYNLVKKERNR